MSAAFGGPGERADLEGGVRGGPGAVLRGCCTALYIDPDKKQNVSDRRRSHTPAAPSHSAVVPGSLKRHSPGPQGVPSEDRSPACVNTPVTRRDLGHAEQMSISGARVLGRAPPRVCEPRGIQGGASHSLAHLLDRRPAGRSSSSVRHVGLGGGERLQQKFYAPCKMLTSVNSR